jgi:hypothetical protein
MRDQRTDQLIEEADLDPKIVSIVHALHNNGYTTWNSCQGGPGHSTTVALIELETDELTSQDRETIRGVVRRYTSVPFSVRRSPLQVGEHYRLVFKAPL